LKVFFAISNTVVFLLHCPRDRRRRGSPTNINNAKSPQAFDLRAFRVRSRAVDPVVQRVQPQTQLLDQGPIAGQVRGLQVVEQLATAADHLEQAATRMVIFGVGLEVPGQIVDACGEQRHLDFRRTGVALGALVIHRARP
jgi:hypothetical protein